ncbi:M48 family metallopeptidase [Eggerthellaceae bacterium zg-997]|nr:M48 family metallopeptidase [Eggerthellaceae bacterium zg-997]
MVVYELAHLIERGYGPAFQHVIDRHLPEWHQVRSLLRYRPFRKSAYCFS